MVVINDGSGETSSTKSKVMNIKRKLREHLVNVKRRFNRKEELSRDSLMTSLRKHLDSRKEGLRKEISAQKSALSQLQSQKEKIIKAEKETKENIKETRKQLDNLHTEEHLKEEIKLLRTIQKETKIAYIEIDERGRYVLTTEPLKVEFDDREVDIGRYKIRVDFNRGFSPGGIRVLNLDVGERSYDHPCINATVACWGTIGTEVAESFDKQDLYQITLDVLAFLTSPDADKGNPYMSWEDFLSKGQPRFNTSFPKIQDKYPSYYREVDSNGSGRISRYVNYIEDSGVHLSTASGATASLPGEIVARLNKYQDRVRQARQAEDRAVREYADRITYEHRRLT